MFVLPCFITVWLIFPPIETKHSVAVEKTFVNVLWTVAGVSVSNSTFNSLVQRYSNREGKIEFDDYIHCIARLCTMFGVYRPSALFCWEALNANFLLTFTYKVFTLFTIIIFFMAFMPTGSSRHGKYCSFVLK